MEMVMDKPIRVLLANRPRLMCELILATFSDQPDIEIVDEVPDGPKFRREWKKPTRILW